MDTKRTRLERVQSRARQSKYFIKIAQLGRQKQALLGLFFISTLFLGSHFLLKNTMDIPYSAGALSVMEHGVNVAMVPLPPPVTHVSTPKQVKAIYMTSWVAGTPNWRSELVQFVENTEVNSIVLDIKDYSGHISWETGDPEIMTVGSEESRIADLHEFIRYLHEKNIYVIGRITAFQDPIFAKKHPELAVQDARGGIWKDRNGLMYIDPSAKSFWDYLVAIGKVAERAGFDELNYDYIRFPSDGPMQYVSYPISGPHPVKADVIEQFFAYLDSELSETNIPLSADLFGFVTEHTDDLNIGQVLERADPYFDFIAPMVYPSHYPAQYLGLQNPAAHPYEVIYNAMAKGSARLEMASSTRLKLRPWLQDFDLGAEYTAEMVRQQIQATYDSGLHSWMMWDPANRYTRGAYLSEP